jgi:trimethylguanosine synthase
VERDMDLAESEYEDMEQLDEDSSEVVGNEEPELDVTVETSPAEEHQDQLTVKESNTEDIILTEEGKVVKKSQQQKKKKKKQNKRTSLTSLPEEVASNKILRKYWIRRYQLFSKFDEGIKLDEGKGSLSSFTVLFVVPYRHFITQQDANKIKIKIN